MFLLWVHYCSVLSIKPFMIICSLSFTVFFSLHLRLWQHSCCPPCKKKKQIWACCWVIALSTVLPSSPHVFSTLLRLCWEMQQTLQCLVRMCHPGGAWPAVTKNRGKWVRGGIRRRQQSASFFESCLVVASRVYLFSLTAALKNGLSNGLNNRRWRFVKIFLDM